MFLRRRETIASEALGAFPPSTSTAERRKKKNTNLVLLPLFFFHHQASRPAAKRASVAVRASDNEVDVDAIVKDIQQKVRRY